jgi:hypothetical protein
MTKNDSVHSFHIPVMGLAYTIDSYTCGTVWISSVISIADDELIEKWEVYNQNSNIHTKK